MKAGMKLEVCHTKKLINNTFDKSEICTEYVYQLFAREGVYVFVSSLNQTEDRMAQWLTWTHMRTL